MSVVIPTCDRGPLLLDTVHQLLALQHPPREIVLVDQSTVMDPAVRARLQQLSDDGAVRWIRRHQRCIPAAMNAGARLARGEVVLYLDDDVRLDGELVLAHARAHAAGQDDAEVQVIAGRVIQPWQQRLDDQESGGAARPDAAPDAFRFNGSAGGLAPRFMGGNVSLRRSLLFELGGFDENFVGAAYRFEADFAQRVRNRGFAIRFEPAASLFHLKAPQGGTRSFGSQLRTVMPWHSTGRYYYLLLHPRTPGILTMTMREIVHTVAARQHLRRPWWIPLSAVAEVAGFAWAVAARLRGPRLGLAGGGAG